MTMQIGKVSADLPTMHSGGRSYDTQSQSEGRQVAKNMPSNDDQIVNQKKVKEITTQLNNFIDPTLTNLKFEYHEDLNEYYVTVVNPVTKEVIKEIPSKKMLDMYAAMVEFMGVLIDEKI